MTLTDHVVRRARLRVAGGDSIRVRRQLDAALHAAEWEASRIPPRSILCVRTVRLALADASNRREPPRTLGKILSSEAAGAARPARGPVPAGENAVFFEDEAELIACLARDWCQGETRRWWWKTLFPEQDLATAVRQTLRDHSPSLPWALAHLDEIGLAERFVAKLSDDDREEAWRRLIGDFALGDVEAAWNEPVGSAPSAINAISHASVPWKSWMPRESALPEQTKRLLVAALGVVRKPGVIRSSAFVETVREWRRAQILGAEAVRTDATAAAISRDKVLPQIGDAGFRIPEPGNSAAASREVEEAAPPESPAILSMHNIPPRAGEYSSLQLPAEPHELFLPSARVIVPDEANAPEFWIKSDTARIRTSFGGVFYLVNVARALKLYGDFTNPVRPGLSLPLWDFMALVAQKWLGNRFAKDALSALLARLSGRSEDEPPGAFFEPPGKKDFGEWLEQVSARLELRLTAALPTYEVEALRALVLCHEARVEAGTTSVDVHFSLSAHPLPLRMAGLDRDPGWVPAAGRSLVFHYE